ALRYSLRCGAPRLFSKQVRLPRSGALYLSQVGSPASPSPSVGRAPSTLSRPTGSAPVPGVPATIPATTTPATTPAATPAATPGVPCRPAYWSRTVYAAARAADNGGLLNEVCIGCRNAERRRCHCLDARRKHPG